MLLLLIDSCSLQDIKKVPHHRRTNCRECLSSYCDCLALMISAIIENEPKENIVCLS
jgi:hypothetical protein